MTFTRATMKMDYFTVLDNFTGKTAVSTKDSLFTAKNMDTEFGAKEIRIKNMKASFCKIEKMATASTHGITAMSTKDIIKPI